MMEDLISRADAIEAVASADETNGTVKVFSGLGIIDMLKALPSAEAVQGWIPCSERLPSVSGTYLTTTAKGSVCTDHFYNSMTDLGGRHWSYHRSREPVAWMPLPKPYREDGDE